MPATKNSGHFLCWSDFYFVPLWSKFQEKQKHMKKQIVLIAMAGLAVMSGCKEKKQTQDIIAPRVEAVKPSGPVRMQPYSDTRDVQWLGKEYKVEVSRVANDSLPLVKDETGQKFVDNSITVVVRRADGSVAISKKFTKADFESYVDPGYRKAGILEGLVFDKVDDTQLEFAASVSLPQTDEYIPLEVKIDNFGHVKIERDSDMDTSGTGEHDDDDEDV
jgi:hypothetical protein